MMQDQGGMGGGMGGMGGFEMAVGVVMGGRPRRRCCLRC
jgi:hypothetical protein